MPASSRENRAVCFGFGMLSRWSRALVDREPWLFSLLPGVRVAM